MQTIQRNDLLLADDDPDVLEALRIYLGRFGWAPRVAANKAAVYEAIYRKTPGVVLLDLQFGEANGIEILERLTRDGFAAPIIMLTGHATVATAVGAIKMGAFDFLTKPVDLERLRLVLLDAVEHGTPVAAPPPDTPRLIAGQSPAMQKVLDTINEVAPTDAKVLITGESGVGKELVARAIHERSRRRQQEFVAVNMAALPEKLAESVLFGHEKGAFTGADRTHVGWCETANGGTLFLDEIGEMELQLQAKLLRFLQEGAYHRVGSSASRTVDVRLISATNRCSRRLVKDGLLREDLFYRLQVVEIVVPPLRDRREEIRPLVEFFLARAADRHGRPRKPLTTAALAAMESYSWPGNVRELEHVAERMVILTRDDELGVSSLPDHVALGIGLVPGSGSPAPSLTDQDLRQMDQVQRRAILEALENAGGHAVTAARLLGIGQATLYRKLKRYQITLPRQRMSRFEVGAADPLQSHS
jgi:two-component system, NtrC family, response regulator HydG